VSNTFNDLRKQSQRTTAQVSSSVTGGSPPHARKHSEHSAPPVQSAAIDNASSSQPGANQPRPESVSKHILSVGQTSVSHSGQVRSSIEPKPATAEAPAPSNGSGPEIKHIENSTITTQRERHDSVVVEPRPAQIKAHEAVNPSSNGVPNELSLNALELEQLKDEVGQLKRENAGLKEKLQEMQHEIEAVQTLSEKQLRKATLEIKLEQLEMGKRVERIYQAEERRQLKGSAQAPFHLIAKIGEFLPSVVAVDQETDEK
jgi:hypothetical protein